VGPVLSLEKFTVQDPGFQVSDGVYENKRKEITHDELASHWVLRVEKYNFKRMLKVNRISQGYSTAKTFSLISISAYFHHPFQSCKVHLESTAKEISHFINVSWD